MADFATRARARPRFTPIAPAGTGREAATRAREASLPGQGAQALSAAPVGGDAASPAPPRGGRGRTGTRGSAGRRGRGILLLAGAAALGLLLVFLASPSLFVLKRVEVLGNQVLSSQDIIAAAGVVAGSALLSTDLGKVERNLEAWAPLRRAKASLAMPDLLRIEVAERRPVAYVLVELEGLSRPVAVDVEGVAYARVGGTALPELPLLSGLRFEDWRPGQRLPDFLLPTLSSLGELEGKEPDLAALFSEIRVERSAWGETELVLFPLHLALPVRTGAKLDAGLLRTIVLVLDALDREGMAAGVDEIDFRTGTIVFRTKEGRSG